MQHGQTILTINSRAIWCDTCLLWFTITTNGTLFTYIFVWQNKCQTGKSEGMYEVSFNKIQISLIRDQNI